MRSQSSAAIVALLAFSLSGCVRAESIDSSDSADATAPSHIDAGSASGGAIVGSVVNEELVPIENALVAIDDLTPATTDASGRYSVEGLEPGEHRLIAQALGYESVARRIALAADETLEIQIVLVRLEILDPHTLLFIKSGIVRCGISYVYIADSCNVANVFGASEARFSFNVSVGHQALVVETNWPRKTEYMDHDFWTRSKWNDTSLTIVGHAIGLPILRKEFRAGENITWTTTAGSRNAYFPESDTKFVFRADTYYDGQYQQELNSTAPTVCQNMAFGYCAGVGVALDFKFTQYVSVFMHASPGDLRGYSAIPDQ